jgi:hypothetical protein
MGNPSVYLAGCTSRPRLMRECQGLLSAAEGNQTVHYIARWFGVNSRRRVGTWPETVSPERERDSKSRSTVCPQEGET